MKQKRKLLGKNKSFNERRVYNSILGRMLFFHLFEKVKANKAQKKKNESENHHSGNSAKYR